MHLWISHVRYNTDIKLLVLYCNWENSMIRATGWTMGISLCTTTGMSLNNEMQLWERDGLHDLHLSSCTTCTKRTSIILSMVCNCESQWSTRPFGSTWAPCQGC